MAFTQSIKLYLREELNCLLMHRRCYSSKIDWKKLRPMILKRINNRADDYPLKSMIPLANDVLKERDILIAGVSALLNVIPVKACKYCPEVYIGAIGHKIKTCHGFNRMIKDREHHWVDGSLNDILVPVETFHLDAMFQSPIKHDNRFDFDRVPAVIELCSQAGAEISPETSHSDTSSHNNDEPEDFQNMEEQREPDIHVQMAMVGQRTLEAWENVRLGVQKLLLVYNAKVCEHCKEVHVGPTGHKARLCGVFKYEGWRGTHWWKKAGVDDLLPAKTVWHRRPQDPPVLENSGRGFYGHAHAVVEMCLQAGAKVPKKYHTMMKVHGLPAVSRSLMTT